MSRVLVVIALVCWKKICYHFSTLDFLGESTLTEKMSANSIPPPPKTNMAMKNPPFEDAFPIEPCGFSSFRHVIVSFRGCRPWKLHGLMAMLEKL